jgi:peptide/nickel transport system permease protein
VILRATISRLGSTLAVLVAAMALLFVLTLAIPGDPAAAMLGPRATPEAMAEITRQMGLDQPVPLRLWRFFALLATGDFGRDLVSSRPIRDMVFEVLPFTLALAGAVVALALALGVPAGIQAATHPGSRSDRLLGLAGTAFVALPNFVVAIGLLLLFSLALHFLPVQGAGEPDDFPDQLRHLVLPVLAIGLGWIGYIARMVRASLLEVLSQPYIRTARAFGIGEHKIIWKLALRNAAIPTLAALGVGFGRLLGGAVFADIIFARPGLGTLIFTAIQARNYPVVQAGVFVTILLFVATNLVVDALFLWLDPRLRAVPVPA